MNERLAPIPDFNVIKNQDPQDAQKVWEAVNKGWEPGKTGKGMLVGDRLYHWNTKGDDGWPHHHHVVDLMHETGVPVLNEEGKLTPHTHLLYYIDPDGTFDSSDATPGNPVDERIRQIDPRLNLDSEGWKFGGYWTDQQKANFPEDFEPDMGEDPNDQPRRYTRPEIMDLVRRGWTEGSHGKALIDESGRRYQWVADRYGGPHHHEVEDAIPGCVAADEILIDPDGTEHSWRTMMEEDDLRDEAKEHGFGSNWVFGSWDEEPVDTLDWDEGNEGKGILDGDGHLHTWNGDDYETHNDYLATHPEVNHENAHYLYISPHGKATTVWGTLGPEHEQLIREADPRLYVDLDVGNGVPWNFGA